MKQTLHFQTLHLMLIAAFCFLAVGCDCHDGSGTTCSGGTGTGNPDTTSGSPAIPDPSTGPTLKSTELFLKVCEKIEFCHSELQANVCGFVVSRRNDISVQIGVPMNTYPNVSEIENGESRGEIVAVQAPFDSCTLAVSNLDCGSQTMIEAYQSTLADPFVGVSAMFAPVCTGAFTLRGH